MVHIRDARPEDADRIADILRRSIVDLCVPDHHGNPEAYAGWISNKTPESVLEWIADPVQRLVVATNDAEGLLGTGAVNEDGEVLLLYVSPEARYLGVSTAILAFLESHLRMIGQRESCLVSTRTAQKFYERRGYEAFGEPKRWPYITAQPMRKKL